MGSQRRDQHAVETDAWGKIVPEGITYLSLQCKVRSLKRNRRGGNK